MRHVAFAIPRLARATRPIPPLAIPRRPKSQALISKALVPSARCIHASSVLLPPAVFVGLLGALWLWKCTMMVLFQNKIIYMPGMPPNARRELIADYASLCGGIRWEEKQIASKDGTRIGLCVSSVSGSATSNEGPENQVYVLYFQGNASSLPPRLPDLSHVLRKLAAETANARYTLVAVSYRGYWTSRGRPSEQGINMDAEAALDWTLGLHKGEASAQSRPVVVLWGQSIGCGIATNLAASRASHGPGALDALVLETPFTSVRAMLEALYPQKWLPYRHLWPFLRNHLDNLGNLDRIQQESRRRGTDPPTISILEAGRDELVPPEHGALLLQRCLELGIQAEKNTVRGAYHNEAIVRVEGKAAVAAAVKSAALRPHGNAGAKNDARPESSTAALENRS